MFVALLLSDRAGAVGARAVIAGRLAVMLLGLVILAWLCLAPAWALAVLRILRRPGGHAAGDRVLAEGRAGAPGGWATATSPPPARPRALHRHAAAAVRRGRREGGRDVADIDMMIEVKVSFDRDGDAAMHAHPLLGRLGLNQEQSRAYEDPVRCKPGRRSLGEQTARRFIVSPTRRAREKSRPT